MHFWLVLAAALLLAPIAGVWPPQRVGRALNAFAYIAMPNDIYGARWRAISAQEVVEWWAAWAGAIALSAVPAWLVASTIPFGWAIAPLLILPAWRWRTTDTGRRVLEYLGWAATWIVGQRVAPDYYNDIEAHAARMVAGYRVFDQTSAADGLRRMRRALPLARVLIVLLSLRIRKGQP